MPLSSSIVDTAFRERTFEVDERALMAFAAGVGDALPELVDTARPGGIVPHPCFPTALEWMSLQDVAAALRERGLGRDEARLAAPIDYDLTWHRQIRAGDVLRLGVEVRAVQPTPAGGVITVVQSTWSTDGSAVTSSCSRVLFPDVGVEGAAVFSHGSGPLVPDPPDRGAGGCTVDLRAEWSNVDAVLRRGHRRIGAPAAHVFSECTGIWNPVCTDKAVALRHGRAFLTMPPAGVLAMAVGGALQLGSTDPSWVRRVRAEFGGPVPVPSILEIEAEVPHRPSTAAPLRFRAHLQDGTPAIAAGIVVSEPSGVDIDLVRQRVQAERTRLAQAARRAFARNS